MRCSVSDRDRCVEKVKQLGSRRKCKSGSLFIFLKQDVGLLSGLGYTKGQHNTSPQSPVQVTLIGGFFDPSNFSAPLVSN